MIDPKDAMAVNRLNWNSRVPLHIGPGGYDTDALVNDPTTLSDVVRFDRERLGDLSGKSVVHLQCHIGTDTISLARLGDSPAPKVTGLDFSEDALVAARDLSTRCGNAVEFVTSNVYDAPDVLGRERFDLVYTGIGALAWLPDIEAWGQVVADLLRPGGRLHLYEIHPMFQVLGDDAIPENPYLKYPYFCPDAPILCSDGGTYAGEGQVGSPDCYEWAHSIGSVVNAALKAGLQVTALHEWDTVPWRAYSWMEPVEGTPGLFNLPECLHRKLPVSYLLQAVKPGGADSR